MEIKWNFSDQDVAKVKKIITENSEAAKRRLKSIERRKSKNVTRTQFWEAMVRMRLTTRVRITPKGKLAQLPRGRRFPFRYSLIRNDASPLTFQDIMENYGVGRHRELTSDELADNFDRLTQRGEWRAVLRMCNSLRGKASWKKERAVADAIQERFQGFGPKQSRNLLQYLGLARFEVPIDSRVTKWLNEELKFPFVVSPKGLQDQAVYQMILDGLRLLCEKAEFLPCALDAAVFSAGGAPKGK